MPPTALRVAFVSLHTSPVDTPGSGDAGGMNVVELNQALALGRAGHRADLITRRTDPDSPAVTDIAPGVRLLLLDAGPAERLAKSAQEVCIEPFRAELFDLPPYDVLFSQHWMSGIAAISVARSWGCPHVQSFHSIAAAAGADLSEGEQAESPGRPDGERLLAQESDAVIAISQAEARTIATRLGADPARVHVIPPGVDREHFRPLEPGEGCWQIPGLAQQPANGYVAFAARLQPLKAPDLAIAAMAAIPAERRPHLVIAGETSQDFADYRAELDRLVTDSAMQEYVTFIGPQSRSDLAEIFRCARLLLVPSYSETFGLVVIEAAASGVPAVAAAAGGLTEAVRDGESGVLMHNRDPQEWAAAIDSLLSDPERYEQMSDGARERTSTLEWDDAARRLTEVFGALIEQP